MGVAGNRHPESGLRLDGANDVCRDVMFSVREVTASVLMPEARPGPRSHHTAVRHGTTSSMW